MNKKYVKQLRDVIASEKYGFHMMGTVPDNDPKCGSAGCIAGTACYIWPETRQTLKQGYYGYSEEKIADKLGITLTAAYHLFYPSQCHRRTRTQAVATLTKLLETGRVSWGRPNGKYGLIFSPSRTIKEGRR